MEHPQHESNALEHSQKCAGTSTLEHPPKCAGTSTFKKIALEHRWSLFQRVLSMFHCTCQCSSVWTLWWWGPEASVIKWAVMPYKWGSDISSDLSTIYGIICRPNHIWESYTGFKSYVDRGFKSYTDHFRPYMGVYMIIELNHTWSHIWY